jgi:hypothetical protein
VVHRVLGGEEEAHHRPERSGEAERGRSRAAAAPELWPNHAELTQREVDEVVNP